MNTNKQNTAPQIGWLCSYVPQEILLVAGFNPTRLSIEKEAIIMADAYIYLNLCPYIKSVLDLGLLKKADHLDGMVFIGSCDAMRRLYDVWKSYVGTRFVYMIYMPKNRDEGATRYFGTQLRKFTCSLEDEFSVKISNESLNEAIRATNQNRKFMQKIYDLQKKCPLPIKGSKLFELVMDGMTTGKDAFYVKLKQYYDTAKILTSEQREKAGTRILVTGNVIDQVDLFKLIEGAGAEVPAIDTCTGIRHFETLADEDTKDPIDALGGILISVSVPE
ncbi:MAG: 2-hydroxyacyl-CoA dehydratase family protein [Thermodesulfobacteriota bacterium]|nr:2-hydroxyacyl-CoA dehydratase family protein [Thermodesulfobacteriota bacterium]